jgi:uncharacterized membrane protein
MFFFPVGCLILVLFVLFLPFLFLLLFFHVITFGFEQLGFSPEATILILALILFGSMINIPITKRKMMRVERPSFFGFFKKHSLEYQGISVNLGGAVIPVLISLFFLAKIPLRPTLIAIGLMTLVSYGLARIIPGRGIVIPAFIPPIFSALFAFVLVPEFAASVSFVSGVLGILIGGDILNLRKARKVSPGMLSIGGAGVFDGIFLVGIVSVLLTSF